MSKDCVCDVCSLARKMIDEKMCHYICGPSHELVNVIHGSCGDEI